MPLVPCTRAQSRRYERVRDGNCSADHSPNDRPQRGHVAERQTSAGSGAGADATEQVPFMTDLGPPRPRTSDEHPRKGVSLGEVDGGKDYAPSWTCTIQRVARCTSTAFIIGGTIKLYMQTGRHSPTFPRPVEHGSDAGKKVTRESASSMLSPRGRRNLSC